MSHDQLDAEYTDEAGPELDLGPFVQSFIAAVPNPADGQGGRRRLQAIFAAGESLTPDPGLLPVPVSYSTPTDDAGIRGRLRWYLLGAGVLVTVGLGWWLLAGLGGVRDEVPVAPNPSNPPVGRATGAGQPPQEVPRVPDAPPPEAPWYRQSEDRFQDQVILSYSSADNRLLQGGVGVTPSSIPTLRARIGKSKVRLDGTRWEVSSKSYVIRFVCPGDCPISERLVCGVFLRDDGNLLWPPGRGQSFVLLYPDPKKPDRWIGELAVPEEALRAIDRDCAVYRFAVVPAGRLADADADALEDMVTRTPDKAAVREWLANVAFTGPSLRQRLSAAAERGR